MKQVLRTLFTVVLPISAIFALAFFCNKWLRGDYRDSFEEMGKKLEQKINRKKSGTELTQTNKERLEYLYRIGAKNKFAQAFIDDAKTGKWTQGKEFSEWFMLLYLDYREGKITDDSVVIIEADILDNTMSEEYIDFNRISSGSLVAEALERWKQVYRHRNEI
jgi:hypothetical protein